MPSKPLLEKNPVTDSAPIPLNPMSLNADWWRYFEVAPAVLKDRIDRVTGQLEVISHTLPENIKSDADASIDRIIENLRILLELRNNTGPGMPTSRPLQKAYTFKKWLDVIHKRRTLQTELQSESEDLLRNEKRFNAMSQRLDSLTAAYLALPDQSHDKIAQGLALMASWSEMAVNGERFRLQKTALVVLKTQVGRLVGEGPPPRTDCLSVRTTCNGSSGKSKWRKVNSIPHTNARLNWRPPL